MTRTFPADIRDLYEQLDANTRDAEAVVAGLSEEEGARRPETGAWSIAECLDHLATGNRVYLEPMRRSADRARARIRRQPARPGLIGRLFVSFFEPPPKWWSRRKAPRQIRPRTSPQLSDAFARFVASQAEVRAFLDAHAHLDLAGIRFRNPFVGAFHFSLATGLHVITAHERRHLYQAWGIRRALERAARD